MSATAAGGAVQVDYGMPEEMPLGTMGPVLRVLDRLPEHFLVMNGDVLTDLDYADLMRRHTAGRLPAHRGHLPAPGSGSTTGC